MITQSPSRQIVLNFPIEKIKANVNQVCRLKEYALKEKNDLFNTYKIAIVIGFRVGMMNVTLNSVDENKTDCKFEMYNAVGGATSPSSLSDLMDSFLKMLAGFLEGRLVIKTK